MTLQKIVKFLMKLKESEISFNIKEGAKFQELFNHPKYLSLSETEQIEIGLKWAVNLYQKDEQQSFEKYLGHVDLTKYCKNAIILDIGCYLGGKTIRCLEKYEGSEIYGIDSDSRFINVAKYFVKERKAKAHFKVNNAEKLNFPDAYFDVIITENTLEHVHDVRKVMQECNRVLKKVGFMIIKFPSFWNPVSHHLDLVTRTPLIHWFFKYPVLLKAYFSILDERGKNALWYRRKNETPLPFEKGYYVNGTSAMQFHKLIKENWQIIEDGFKHKLKSNSFIKNIVIKFIKVSKIPIFRELFPIVYILQKKKI